ncbi:MAG: amidohydrolase family protein [Micromonosporaceae bacterium]|nr:amidohydrolase family protein [Micromonosporaceae bacterium]
MPEPAGDGWDVHTHLVPPALLAGPELTVADGRLVVDGRPTVPLGRLAEPAELSSWVDRQRLAGALVSLPPPALGYHLSGPDATAWAERANPALAEAVAGDPRLRPLATVPLTEPGAAAGVAAGVLADGRFAGLSLGTLPDSPTGLADPALEPLWELLDARSSFVFLHPGHCPDRRLAPYYLGNLLGNPYETTLATGQLLFGGVLDRFGGITFCLAHGGGLTAAVAGRWQRGVDTDRPGVPAGTRPVRPALRRLLVDDLVHDHDAVRQLVATFGADRVVPGSDWPFPMGANRLDPERARRTASLIETLTRPAAPPA